MAITIKIFEVEATLKNFRWTCQDKEVESFLNSFIDVGEPPQHQANPEYFAANQMVEKFGAEILKDDSDEIAGDGVIY